MFTRSLQLPAAGSETLFLWGPRQTGKTTLLRQRYADSRWVDLLKADEFRRYATRPESLREEIEAEAGRGARPLHVVVDEVQKVPALLDEIHWLIEHRGVTFALCGSSARRVRRAGVNLLGGRALRYELRGLTSGELGEDFDLDRVAQFGCLPRILQSSRPGRLLDDYIADYLRQEIAEEGRVRNLPAFGAFLDAAALGDGDIVNFTNIARECGVSSPTVKEYYGVLEETLLGRWLPAWRRRPKRRTIRAPRFYFSDVGIVNRLARRGAPQRGSDAYGQAFENWAHHELASFLSYRAPEETLSWWRLASGIEVDFILGDMRVAIEAKAKRQVTSRDLRGLRHLADDHPEVRRRIVACLEPKPRRTEDGIEILPAATFAARLWSGELTADSPSRDLFRQ